MPAAATAFASGSDAESIASFRSEIASAPASTPTVIARVLHQAGPDAHAFASLATAEAIRNLGEKPDKKRVSLIVYAAVHANPSCVLDIVHSAVMTDPKEAAEIAASATSAVPSPWKRVYYQRPVVREARAEGTVVFTRLAQTDSSTLDVAPIAESRKLDRKDYKDSKDSKDYKDSKITLPLERDYKDGIGELMSQAEAIVQTAFDSQDGIALSTIEGATDMALVSNPDSMLSHVSGPEANSGVGDAGSSNFANEPHRPVPPPHAPNPPPVSR